MKKRILLGLAVAFLALQFVRPAKNQAAAAPFAGPDDITIAHPPPPEVRQILAAACYDCHSNHTRYPWYAEIQPASWWLARHVRDGRQALNFSEFNAYSAKRQARKLELLCDEVRDHAMPLKSYQLMHPDARLTPAQVTGLCQWAEGIEDQLAEK